MDYVTGKHEYCKTRKTENKTKHDNTEIREGEKQGRDMISVAKSHLLKKHPQTSKQRIILSYRRVGQKTGVNTQAESDMISCEYCWPASKREFPYLSAISTSPY